MYLLDTNVLSATAPTKARPSQQLRDWIRRNSDSLFLSVVTLLEINHGLTWLGHRRATTKAARLALWLDLVRRHYGSRILSVDLSVALRAGELITAARGAGTRVDTEDALIAATADLRSLVVLTDNARHYRPMGIAHLNPFDELPSEVS